MYRLLSIIFSLFAQLVPYVRFSNKKGFYSTLMLVAANSVPVIGVVFFKWNPFIILVIYWVESAIIGFFNVLKMLIAGVIHDGKFSSLGTAGAVFLSLFFTLHYGGFMAGHGIFITVMLGMASKGFNAFELDPFGVLLSLLPSSWTFNSFIKSQLFAIVFLFGNHLVSFCMNFVRTAEYNKTVASDYMTQPYKRIVVMHITIILGFFVMFFSGLRGAGVIIIWVGMKVIADLKMNMNEDTARNGMKEKRI